MGSALSALKRQLTGRFARNSGWMMFQQVYSMVLALIISAVASRYLGPDNVGIIEYGAMFVTFFTAVCRLGLNGLVINDIAKSPEKSGEIMGSALALRLVASVLSIGSIAVIISILKPDDKLILVVAMLQSAALVFDVCEVFKWWFQARLMAKYAAIGSIIAVSVMGAWRIWQLSRSASVEWFAMSSSIQALVSALFVGAMFVVKKDFRLRFSWAMAKDLLVRGRHLLISSLIVQIYLQTDRLMLESMVDTAALGCYSIAMRLSTMWEFVPDAIIDTARPLIAQAKKRSEDEYIKKFKLLLLGISIMGIAVGLLFTFFGRHLVWLLYGDAFLPAAAPLSIMIWTTTFALIGTARGIWLIAEGLYKYLKYMVAIGALFNVVTNLLLIPVWGMVGAALTTLASQAIVALVVPLLFKETRPFVSIYLSSFKLLPEYIAKFRRNRGK